MLTAIGNFTTDPNIDAFVSTLPDQNLFFNWTFMLLQDIKIILILDF